MPEGRGFMATGGDSPLRRAFRRLGANPSVRKMRRCASAPSESHSALSTSRSRSRHGGDFRVKRVAESLGYDLVSWSVMALPNRTFAPMVSKKPGITRAQPAPVSSFGDVNESLPRSAKALAALPLTNSCISAGKRTSIPRHNGVSTEEPRVGVYAFHLLALARETPRSASPRHRRRKRRIPLLSAPARSRRDGTQDRESM